MDKFYALCVFLGLVSTLVNVVADRKQLCEGNIDLACVKKYFGEKGECSVVDSPNDEITIKEYPFYLPKVNISSVCQMFHLRNIGGNVLEFYLDEATNYLVMSVEFTDSSGHYPKCHFAVTQDQKAPIFFSEDVNATYSSVIVTAAIFVDDNTITETSLRTAFYSAYFPNDDAHLTFGPNFSQSEDPVVSASYEEFFNSGSTLLAEIYRTKAMLDFLIYLQNYICDFNIIPSIADSTISTIVQNSEAANTETGVTELCDQTDDITACVRDYFEEQGTCSVVRQSDDEPVNRVINTIFVPFLNLSIIVADAQISGLNGQIQNIFINKHTNNLVITVAFEDLTIESQESIIVIYKMGEIPGLLADSISITFDGTLTASIPLSEGLTSDALKKSFVTTYFTQPSSLNFGSRITSSEDPAVMAVVEAKNSNPMTVGQEIFLTEGYSAFASYLQKYICDFGITSMLYDLQIMPTK